MNASQSGKYRSPELKFQMQLMGTLAEIYVKAYLQEALRENGYSERSKVIRYDDVRTDDFRSSSNEFDISIHVDNQRIYHIESRSSIARDRSLMDAIMQFDIIGPYSSVAKSGEGYNSFYVRPLYDYVPFRTQSYLPSNFERDLKSSQIRLFIVGGCTKKQMITRGYNKNMGQGSTEYRVLSITDGYDATQFKKVLFENILS